MQVGLRTFEHRWRDCCPIREAQLKARRGLCCGQWNMLKEIFDLVLLTFLVDFEGGGLV
jgi:hypothetical protein